MPRFVIHTGPHKTGTTYIQERLAELRPELASRGILYPSVWGPVTHHKLYDMLAAPTPNAELEQQFCEVLATACHTVVISVEGLTLLPAEKVAYFRRLLGDADANVIFYVRSWADLLPSHWNEEVKGGRMVLTFPEYAYQRLHNPVSSSLINFSIGLTPYADIFGFGTLRLVSYDVLMRNQIDLFEHFASSFLNVSDLPKQNRVRSNVSPSPMDAEILRVFSVMERERRGHAPPVRYMWQMMDRYLQLRERLQGSKLFESVKRHMSSVVINENSDALRRLHNDLFDLFAQAMVPPRTQQRILFPARRAEVQYVRPDYLVIPGVVEQLHELHQIVAQGIEIGPI